MKFTLTFTPDQISAAKKHALGHIAEHLTLKGFRQGKAPMDLVEKSTDPEKLIEETASHLIPEAYTKYIIDNKLQPIVQPKISMSKMTPEGEWEFDVEIAERPEVTLNNYLKAVKAIKAPKAESDDQKAKEAAESKKLSLVFDALLKTSKVEIPELLVEEEVNRTLSRLVEQVNRLGITIDQYVASLGKKPEELREEYKKTSTENLQIEFILDAIGKDQKIEASAEDVEAVFATVTDEKMVADARKNPTEMANIKYSLTKRKIIDFLLAHTS